MDKKLFISPSPHTFAPVQTRNLMYGVLLALVPAYMVSLFYFGIGALYVMLVAVVSCVLTEYLITRYLLKRKNTITDGSAILTGVLLAMNVPTNLPWWMLVVGSVVAIGIAKLTFGGLGNNPFNPALVGRVFMLISFPVQMTSWPLPLESRMQIIDGLTGATPLAVVKEGLKNGSTMTEISKDIPSHLDMFIGQMGGSMGEISAAALLLGLVYMLYKKIITWHIPVSVLGSAFLLSGILWLISPEKFADPVFHLLSGGLMLGAIFMATDYVTSPMSQKGMIVYGVSIGLLTIVIRVWGAYPEGVSFAILILNAFVPLINRGFKPAKFGEVNKHGK